MAVAQLRTRRAWASAVALTYVTFAFGAVGTAIVARVVSAEDMGLFALVAASFVAVTWLGGLNLADVILVGESDRSSGHARAALAVAATLALVVFIAGAGADLFGIRFGGPAGFVALVGLQLAMSQLAGPTSGLLLYHHRPVANSLLGLAGAILGVVVAVAAAKRGYGRWALPLRELATSVVIVTGGLILLRDRTSGGFVRADLRRVLSVGAGFQVGGVLESIFYRMDTLLLGVYSVRATLGQYAQAMRFAMYPHAATQGLLWPYILSALAERNESHEVANARLRTGHLFGVTVCVGITGWLLFGASALLPVFFGGQWEEAARILRYAAPFAGLTSYFDALRAIQSARREIRWIVISRGVMLIVVATVGTAIISSRRSAYAMGLVMASSLLAGVITMIRGLRTVISWRVVARHVSGVITCGLLASLVAVSTGLGTRGAFGAAAESAIWGMVYLVALYALWRRDPYGDGATLIALLGFGRQHVVDVDVALAAASDVGPAT